MMALSLQSEGRGVGRPIILEAVCSMGQLVLAGDRQHVEKITI